MQYRENILYLKCREELWEMKEIVRPNALAAKHLAMALGAG
ncbi:MAG TPA: hypothetical protein VFV38_19360 [Ktedonobacteraceae bacterium]|nr:hypothetical protein [Ktedonobacteraceae bacterium]